jgi:hypothetical protein
MGHDRRVSGLHGKEACALASWDRHGWCVKRHFFGSGEKRRGFWVGFLKLNLG